MAGPNDLAGFMDAPQMGPANMASKPTMEPIARPANRPRSLLPVATLMITSIRKKVRMNSKTNYWPALPVGIVAPRN